MESRVASCSRVTKETQIEMTLNLDGTGKTDISTGIGFFDHMLSGFARHGLFDLTDQSYRRSGGRQPPHDRGYRNRVGADHCKSTGR